MLRRGINGTSQRLLTLRNMEQDELVTRSVTRSIPPPVDYKLMNIGPALAER